MPTIELWRLGVFSNSLSQTSFGYKVSKKRSFDTFCYTLSCFPSIQFGPWDSSSKTDPRLPNLQDLQDIETFCHDGAWREEVEIELRDSGDESYTGTITIQEFSINSILNKRSSHKMELDLNATKWQKSAGLQVLLSSAGIAGLSWAFGWVFYHVLEFR